MTHQSILLSAAARNAGYYFFFWERLSTICLLSPERQTPASQLEDLITVSSGEYIFIERVYIDASSQVDGLLDRNAVSNGPFDRNAVKDFVK
jgi:hypothetical protein